MDNPAAGEGSEAAGGDEPDPESGGAALGQFVEASGMSQETARLLLAAVQEDQITNDANPLMKAVVDRLAGAPTNWHQCMVYAMTTEAEADAELRAVGPVLVVGSCVIVGAQCATVVAIVAGTLFQSCANNDFCEQNGDFCNLDTLRCSRCGSAPPLRMQTNTVGETFNKFTDPRFVGYNTTAFAELCDDPVATVGLTSLGVDMKKSVPAVMAWCQRCFTFVHGGALAGEVDPMTAHLKATLEVDSMDLFDWMAMFFSVVIVSFAVVGELQDIKLCTVTVDKATGGAKSGVRVAAAALSGARRWVFLPALTVCIPLLVFMQGADALSVCLNTVSMKTIPTLWATTFNFMSMTFVIV